MNAFAKLLLILVSLLSLANMAQPMNNLAEQDNRARRGLLESTGGLKRQPVTKNHRTVAITLS